MTKSDKHLESESFNMDLQGLPKHRQIFETLRHEIMQGRYMSNQRLPSEAQLVRRFGVSRPTASRALRDLQSAGFLERRPGSGTYLRHGAIPHTGTFGLLIPGLGTTEIFNPICTEISRCAQAEGFGILWGDSSDQDLETRSRRAEELCQQYVQRKVAGVFFEPLELTSGREEINRHITETLIQNHIPVVLLDRDLCQFPERSPFDMVGIDNFTAGFRATTHLLKLGAKRIRFLARPGSAPTVELRIAGAREAFARTDITPEEDWIAYGDPADEKFVRTLLRGPGSKRVDGLVCANDITAATLIHTFSLLEIKVPADVRLVSFDDVKYATLLSPPLTTIHQPCRDIGTTAVHVMLQRLKDPNMPPQQILLDAPLVVRKSCGAGK